MRIAILIRSMSSLRSSSSSAVLIDFADNRVTNAIIKIKELIKSYFQDLFFHTLGDLSIGFQRLPCRLRHFCPTILGLP